MLLFTSLQQVIEKQNPMSIEDRNKYNPKVCMSESLKEILLTTEDPKQCQTEAKVEVLS